MRLAQALLAVPFALFLSACTFYPLNMTEAEWLALTPEQRLEAREAQQRLNAEARQAREQQALQQEQLRLQQEALRLQRLQSAEYGERLQCVLREGTGYIGGQWRPLQPLAVELLSGDAFELELRDVESDYRQVKVVMSFDGQTVRVCDAYQQRCANLVSTTRGYERGERASIQLERTVRATLLCDLPPRSRR